MSAADILAELPRMSPDEIDRYLAEQAALVAKLAKAANIKPE